MWKRTPSGQYKQKEMYNLKHGSLALVLKILALQGRHDYANRLRLSCSNAWILGSATAII